tara:strand:- start:1004 stop:1603 length:600 start_codon:yes stop_codon:yes gene_type:complete
MSLNTGINYNVNEAEIDRLTEDIANDLLAQIQWGLESSDGNISGNRHGKINYTKDLAESFSVQEIEGFKCVVTDNPYSGFVEYGTPAGNNININIDDLRAWVFHKLGVTDENQNLGVTFKIAKNIMKNGIPARRFIKKAIKRMTAHGSVPKKQTVKKSILNKVFSRVQKKLRKLNRTQKKIIRKINKIATAYKKVRKYK